MHKLQFVREKSFEEKEIYKTIEKAQAKESSGQQTAAVDKIGSFSWLLCSMCRIKTNCETYPLFEKT